MWNVWKWNVPSFKAHHHVLMFLQDVLVNEHHKSYWIRIYIPPRRQGSKPAKGHAMYLIHPPRTQYLLVANLRVAHTQCISQVRYWEAGYVYR